MAEPVEPIDRLSFVVTEESRDSLLDYIGMPSEDGLHTLLSRCSALLTRTT